MTWYLDQIRILNNYQGTRDYDNNFNLPLGTDYSNTYSRQKGCLLFIGDIISATSIAFKAFLTNFSITLTLEHADKALVEGKKESVKTLGFNYSMEIIIPAISVDDARVNATRLEMLEIMLSTSNVSQKPKKKKKKTLDDAAEADKKQKTTTIVPKEERKVVLLSNLINNGKYTNKKEIANFENLKEYGLECFIENLSYTANVEAGFFEYDNKIWPKEYSLKLDLIVPTKSNNKSLIKLFTSDGKINSDELTSDGSWPFGVGTL